MIGTNPETAVASLRVEGRRRWARPPAWSSAAIPNRRAISFHLDKKEIKADVEDVLPPGSSGIVALFEEQWVEEVEKALAKADKVSSHDINSDSAEQVKASATS